MKVLAHKEMPLVQAANDDVAVESFSQTTPAMRRADLAIADGSSLHYEEPSAAAHIAAMALSQQVHAPA